MGILSSIGAVVVTFWAIDIGSSFYKAAKKSEAVNKLKNKKEDIKRRMNNAYTAWKQD